MQRIWMQLSGRAARPIRRRPQRERLTIEALEERALMTTSPFGTISGTAFLDVNRDGHFNAGDVALTGVSVTVVGTGANSALTATTKTNAQGAFLFSQIPQGTYQLKAGPTTATLTGGPGFAHPAGQPGIDQVSDIVIVPGINKTVNVGFATATPASISSSFSLRDYLSSSTVSGIPFAAAGAGKAILDAVPVLSNTNTQVFVASSTTNSALDLAGYFSDANITDQGTRVQFDTSIGGIAQNPILVDLFAKSAPQTVANFLDYVKAGNYNNSIFDRLAAGFVLQGGTYNFDSTNASKLVPITTNPAVPNEFGASNTKGTIAMAKTGADPNSATDAFFFNLANNASNLDHQNEGFTVFGTIVGAADQAVLNSLTATSTTPTAGKATIVNESSAGFSNTFPLVNFTSGTFPSGTTANNFLRINDVKVVKQNDALTYSIVPGSINDPDGIFTSAPTLSATANERLLFTTANKTGTATLTIRATDLYGASVDTTFTVHAVAKPTVTVKVDNTKPTAQGKIVATAVPTGVAGKPVSVTFVWEVNNNPNNVLQTVTKTVVSGATATDTLDLSKQAGLTAGTQISVVVTPNTNLAKGDAQTATATVSDGTPVVNSVTLSPSPNVDDVVTATVQDTGSNGHGISLTYQWSITHNSQATVVSTVTTTSTTDTLDLTKLPAGVTVAVGDTVSVKVTPADNILSKTGASITQTVTVAQTKPTVSNIQLTPAGPAPGDIVTATVQVTDADSDGVSLKYEWSINSTPIPSATTTTTSTTATLDLTKLPQGVTVNDGDTVSVTVTPTDGTIVGDPLSKSTTISASPPVVSNVSLTPAGAAPDDTVTATVQLQGTDNSTVKLKYEWSINSTPVPSLTTTTSALTSKLDLSKLPAGTTIKDGDTLTVSVTPIRGSVTGTAVTQSVTIASTAPVINSVTLTPQGPARDDTLTATVDATDADQDAFNLKYEWTLHSAATNKTTVLVTTTTAATTNTLDLAKLLVKGIVIKTGDTVSVKVTPVDGVLTGTSVTKTVTIADLAPTISNVTLTSAPTVADTVTANVTATDADGDGFQLRYVWSVKHTATGVVTVIPGATTITTATTASLDLARLPSLGVHIAKGDVVTVKVTPIDGVLTGATDTKQVTVADSAPVILSANLQAATPGVKGKLTTSALAGDADNDAVTFKYSWSINSTTVTGATSSSLDLSKLPQGVSVAKGDTVSVTITPTDGSKDGTPVTKTIVVADTAPVVSQLAIQPTQPSATATLTATANVSDQDTDSVTVTFVWTIGGQSVKTTSGSSLTSSLDLSTLPNVKKGTKITVTAMPNDGTLDGVAVSQTVTVV